MDTIRDSAFGKLVRFLSGYRLLLYPEEEDHLAWRQYLRTEAYQQQAIMPVGSREFYEEHSLYTVISQASRRRRERPPLRSVLAGPWRGIKEGSPEAIGWRGSDDPEVRPIENYFERFFSRQRDYELTLVESAKLDHHQEDLSHAAYLPSYFLYLYWFRHLHTRNSWCGCAVWSE